MACRGSQTAVIQLLGMTAVTGAGLSHSAAHLQQIRQRLDGLTPQSAQQATHSQSARQALARSVDAIDQARAQIRSATNVHEFNRALQAARAALAAARRAPGISKADLLRLEREVTTLESETMHSNYATDSPDHRHPSQLTSDGPRNNHMDRVALGVPNGLRSALDGLRRLHAQLDLEHIFTPTLTADGRLSGYHHARVLPATAQVGFVVEDGHTGAQLVDLVFSANGRTFRKPRHTMFSPESSRDDVIRDILSASVNLDWTRPASNGYFSWQGRSATGIVIRGFTRTLDGRIRSAYPVVELRVPPNS